jgi:hypothetical protein
MSDTILRVFPVDPEFVPDPAAAARVVEDARQLFWGRWVDVETETSKEVVFVDNGQNLERIKCPLVAARLTSSGVRTGWRRRSWTSNPSRHATDSRRRAAVRR